MYLLCLCNKLGHGLATLELCWLFLSPRFLNIQIIGISTSTNYYLEHFWLYCLKRVISAEHFYLKELFLGTYLLERNTFTWKNYFYLTTWTPKQQSPHSRTQLPPGTVTTDDWKQSIIPTKTNRQWMEDKKYNIIRYFVH